MTQPASGKIYCLRVELADVEPLIWRRIEVPGDMPLDDLHGVLQIAFGWEFAHLHAFQVGKRMFEPPSPGGDLFGFRGESDSVEEYLGATVASLLPRTRSEALYIYDFGDEWIHTIIVEKISPAESDGFVPRAIDGKRAGPPEDTGGAYGYMEKLEILQSEKGDDVDELREWFGDFDPEKFDIDAINSQLQQAFQQAQKKSKPKKNPTAEPPTAPKSKAKAKSKSKSAADATPDEMGAKSASKANSAAAKSAKKDATAVAKVTKKIEKGLAKVGLPQDFQRVAKLLWEHVANVLKPTIRKPELYAAAMVRIVCELVEQEITNKELAAHFGVSAVSIGKTVSTILEAIQSDVPPWLKTQWEATGDMLEPVELNAAEREELRKLPMQSELTFLGGVLPLLPPMVPPGFPPDSQLVLWLDSDTNQIRRLEFVSVADTGSVAVRSLFEAMREPVLGTPGRPKTVRCVDLVIAAAIEPALCDLGIALEAAPISDLQSEGVAAALVEFVNANFFDTPGFQPQAGYLIDDITPDEIKTWFVEAKKLVAQAPWKHAYDSDLLELNFNGTWGRNRVIVSIMGQNKEAYGLAIFRSIQHFQAFVQEAEKFDEFDDADDPPVIGTVESLALIFEANDYLTEAQADEVAHYRWPVAGKKWFPIVMCSTPEGRCDPTAEDMRVVMACTAAVAAFVQANPNAFKTAHKTANPVIVPIPNHPELPSIAVTGPLTIF